MAGSVVVRMVPRAASMIAAFAIIFSSGASIRLRKSYCPISAYCACTLRPIASTSAFTAVMRSGFWRTVSQPSGPSVESMAYIGTGPNPSSGRCAWEDTGR